MFKNTTTFCEFSFVVEDNIKIVKCCRFAKKMTVVVHRMHFYHTQDSSSSCPLRSVDSTFEVHSYNCDIRFS